MSCGDLVLKSVIVANKYYFAKCVKLKTVDECGEKVCPNVWPMWFAVKQMPCHHMLLKKDIMNRSSEVLHLR